MNDRLSTERNLSATDANETKTALSQTTAERARRGDVFAMVAHDLRSPLCVIAANAQSIVETTEEARTREAAQEVTLAVARMDRLLRDLLDVARADSGSFRIVKRPHDLCALMTEVRDSYRPLFAARATDFAIDVPVGAVFASCDHGRIVQVLSNVLGNAMKFTPPNGSVVLRLARRAQQVEFVVRDSGPGIRPDMLPHVFERFWQIDSDARRGLGLGLYICEQIVEAHGGRIWAESEYGNGATFRFTLPVN